MKILLLINMAITLLLLSCGLMQSDTVKAFIPGVYARHYTDEYTNSYDTIVIRLITNDNQYGIIKRTRFEKVMNDNRTEPGYSLQKWIGSYDEQTKSLWLQQAGKAIYFNPAKKELTIGTQPYKKL